MIKFIEVKTQFTGFHNWPEAPDEVSFLRHPHRHIFKVKVLVEITEDRGVEFFMLKRDLDFAIRNMFNWSSDWEANLKSKSCEQIATKIGFAMHQKGYLVAGVKVSEDGENASIVRY